VLLALLAVGGSQALNAAADWLHRRPEHTLPFDQITLDPPPPPWIVPGAAGLLEQVRAHAKRPERLAVQELDLAQLAQDFQRESPWVRAVLGVERAYPNRLTVRLEYRQPVAFLRRGSGIGTIYVDRDGVVLPAEELDVEAAGRLIPFQVDLPAGATINARDGRALKIEPAPSARAVIAPDLVPQAAQLAEFVRQRERLEPDVAAAIGVDAIHGQPRSGLWLQFARQKMVRWGAGPGSEAPGEPDAARKWGLLAQWIARNRNAMNALRHPAYLAFERDRVVVAGSGGVPMSH
jgi:hypothetical protein